MAVRTRKNNLRRKGMNKKSIKSNGSNPPFQCEWTKNSNKKNNKKKEQSTDGIDCSFCLR